MFDLRKFLLSATLLVVGGCGTAGESQHGLSVWVGPYPSSASVPQETSVSLGAEDVVMGLIILKSRDGHAYAVRQNTFKLNLEQGIPDIRDLSLRYRQVDHPEISFQQVGSSSVVGDRITFDLNTSSTQALVMGDGEHALQLVGKIVGGIGSVFQASVQADGIVADEIGDVQAVSSVPISGQFPLKMPRMIVAGGGLKAVPAASTPDGTSPLALNRPRQTLLVADVEAVGEDMVVTEIQLNFNFLPSNPNDQNSALSNLFLTDGEGTQIGSTKAVVENYYSGLNYFRPQFWQSVRYLIPQGQVRRFYFYADTNSVAGKISGLGLRLWGQGVATNAKTPQYYVSGPLQGLIIK